MEQGKGIVVAPEPMAAEVGAEVLRAGGNAFDAAVATGFMQMAVDPIQCGLGGWGGGTVFSWNNCVSLMDPLPGCNNSYDPGRARASALSPTILFEDGKPKIVVGAAGGWTISSAVLQAIINIVDFGMSATEAVSAPRFHSEGSPLFCESRIPQKTVRELRAGGIEVEQSQYAYHSTFGRVQCIVNDGSQESPTAASDPRGDGGAAVFA